MHPIPLPLVLGPGSLSSAPQVAGGTCDAPSLQVMYPDLPQFLCSQAPCNDSWVWPGTVALYPVQGGSSDPDSDTGAGCGSGAEQPVSCKDGCQHPSCPHGDLCHAMLHPMARPSPECALGAGAWGGGGCEGSVAAPVRWEGLGAHSLVLTWSAGHSGEGGGAGAGFSPRPL